MVTFVDLYLIKEGVSRGLLSPALVREKIKVGQTSSQALVNLVEDRLPSELGKMGEGKTLVLGTGKGENLFPPEHRQTFQHLLDREVLPLETLSKALHIYQSQSRGKTLFIEFLVRKNYLPAERAFNELEVKTNASLVCSGCHYQIELKLYCPWLEYPCLFCPQSLVLLDPREKNTSKGAKFGPYELIEELGRGGMGVVYKAFDLRLERVVALKVMKNQGPGHGEYLERFNREVRLAARLNHPHILPIYEFGQEEKKPYYTMALIEGEDLKKRIETRGKMAEKEALKLLKSIAEALDYAHGEGVLHRDLKPSNIMIDGEGRPYIMDFGLAREMEEKPHDLTQTGAIVGSPEYMSPEQALGEKNITKRADIYALGGVLFYAITGRPPFQGENPLQILMQVINDYPPAIRNVAANGSRDLEIIVNKCLEKEGGNRYPTAGMVAYDLQAALRDEPLIARPPGAMEKFRRLLKRHRVMAAAISACLALLLVSFSIMAYLKGQEKERKVQNYLKKVEKQLSQKVKPSSSFLFIKGNRPLQENVRRQLENSINACLEARSWLEKARELSPENEEIVKKLFDIESEIGHLALRGRNYIMSRSSFERCAKLAQSLPPSYRKDAQEFLQRLDQKRGEVREKQLAHLRKIMNRLAVRAPDRWEFDQYITEIIRMQGPEIVQALLKSLTEKQSRLQRKLTIEALGKLGDPSVEWEGKDVVEVLMEELKKLDLSKVAEREEGVELIWALGRLRARRAEDLVYDIRYKLGPSSRFWKKTEIPYEMLPLSREGENDREPEEGELDKMVKRAIKLYQKKEKSQALQLCRKVLRQAPHHGMANYLQTLLYISFQRHKDALFHINRALDKIPNFAEGYYLRGLCRQALGQTKAALEDFNQAIQLKPRANFYTSRGVLWLRLNRTERASEDFKKAIKLNPHKSKPHNHLGKLFLRKKGNKKKALYHFNQAIKINPRGRQGYYNRSRFFYRKGEFDRALEDINQAISYHPKVVKFHILRAKILHLTRDFENAIAAIERVLKIKPRNPNALVLLGRLHFAKKNPDFEKALDSVNQTLVLTPQWAYPYRLRGEIYLAQKKWKKALTDFEKALELRPSEPILYFFRGKAFSKVGKEKEALEDLKRFISLKSFHPRAIQAQKIISNIEKSQK